MKEELVSQSFQQETYKELKERGLVKMRQKLNKLELRHYNDKDNEKQFDKAFEIKYWRLSKEYIDLSNELAACTPLYSLWANKDQHNFTMDNALPAFNPKEKIQKHRSDPTVPLTIYKQ